MQADAHLGKIVVQLEVHALGSTLDCPEFAATGP